MSRPRWWWWGLFALTLVALAERLPRMDRSLWGDETLALRGYVTGHFSCSGKDHLHGKVKFVDDPWVHTFFSDDSGGGNNHYLYSIIARATLETWRKWTGQPDGAFSESVLRIWPLLAGLAALWAMAGWLRRLGMPGIGMVAAVLLAIHPWHLRFSGEARGYMLMLPIFILTLWAWTNALERGRWRDWVAVAVGQFFALYAWKGVLYPLVGINVLAMVLIWVKMDREGRKLSMGRWLAVNCVSGMVFVPLVAIAQIQMVAVIPAVARRGNEPLNLRWLENLLCETVLGFPARISDPLNPVEISFQRLWLENPVLTGLSVGVVVVALFMGLFWLIRRSPVLGAITLSVPVGGLLAVVHFKLLLNIELLRWYWFFACPVIVLWLALGAAAIWDDARKQWIAAVVVIVAFAVATWPIRRFHLTQPYENFRGALEFARGKDYRPWLDTGENHTKTVWIWRYAVMYDPRGENDAHTPKVLLAHVDESRREGMGFYLIDGYPLLTARILPEVQAMLDDPLLFEKAAVYWGQMPQQTMYIYKMRAAPKP
ncbi:MAG: glycosyltransferase family 39 protein [Verrucomicrobiaceae bacterium]|nr:glycosyltransferase family 39 protein [Verrucomicrobiaceae bacterium]